MQSLSHLELKDETDIDVVIESPDEVFTLTEDIYLDLTMTKEIDLFKYA